MTTLDLWFDFAGADSHPVAQVVEARAGAAGVTVRWRPFRVAPVERRREEREDLPPPDDQGLFLADYWRQFVHSCELAGVKGRRPHHHPADSIPALRVALTCEAEGFDPAPFIRAVFDAIYVDDHDPADPELLRGFLKGLGPDADRVWERSRALDTRAQLDANTAEALRMELYGAPTMIAADGELHWGLDGLDGAIRSAAAAG